jgi:hypothetical protein
MQRYFLPRLCRTLTSIVTLLYSCANPVPPSGGDKDTTAPVVLSVESTMKLNHNKITVVFNENITSGGPLITSPILPKNDQSVGFTIQREKLKITVPDYTKTIYLDRWLMDLNEKNQLQHKTLLLSGDSGEVHLSINQRERKEKLNVFIKNDSFVYLPQKNKDNTYSFLGLPSGIYKTYIIEKDNNFQINPDEYYNVLYTTSRKTDTIPLTLYPPLKNYKSAYYLNSTNLYCLLGSPVYEEWLKQNDTVILNKDTLLSTYNLAQKIASDLHIDSFIKTNKNISPKTEIIKGVYNNDTFYSLLGLYGFNHKRYLYNTLSALNDTTRKNLVYLSENTIKNESDTPCFIKITNKTNGFNYILILKPKQIKTILLAEGSYSWVSWINNSKNNGCLLNIDGFNLVNQQFMENPELFYQSKKSWIIKRNLSNTLILPNILEYNTGITSN